MPIFDDRQMCRCAHHAGDGFHSKNAPTHYAPDLELEPTHLDIDLRVDPEAETLEGTVTTTVTARVDGPRTIELDAVDFDDLEVRDSGGKKLSHTYDGEKLEITWKKAFDRGEERQLAISYRVEQPVAGVYFSHPSDEYPDRERWGATDHETEKARHWLPCIDHLNVRPTLSFHLRADADFTILANGEHAGTDEHDDGTKTAHWELDFPCPSYLTCFAIGEFTEATDGEFEGIPLAYYAASHHPEERLHRSFGRTGEMLEWMTERLDRPFPFPKYFQFALPSFGGAMENISLVSWDDIFVLNEDLAREWTWLVDQVNVHEMAHSYFGDAVVCRDFAHVWLKESWATYMEQCWLEHKYGRDEADFDFYRNGRAYFSEADDRYARPIVTRKFDSSWDMYDRHLYPGGACRLHMLRRELGDEVFWTAVSDYLETFHRQVVETEDFRRVMEKHSGRSLARFFDQWFYTAGYPHLNVSFGWDPEEKEGTFTIEQKQVGEDGGEGHVFEIPLELGWVDPDGNEHLETVELDRARRTYTFSMDADPKSVRIDPHQKTLFKLEFNPGDEKLRRQLTGAPDVIGRILAAEELAKTGRRKNVRAIAEAYRDEAFWGVRRRFAAALAKAGTRVALDALATIVSDEDDPMVLSGLLSEAGKFRDDRLARAVRDRIDDGDLPPFALAAAWKAIGAQRENADVDALRKAASVASYHEIARGGALAGLAMTRRFEIAETLMQVARHGAAATRARQQAATALGALGRVLEKSERDRVREYLEDLLRDPQLRVAKAAASALVKMGAKKSIAAIEALQARLAHQERVSMTRLVEGLHKTGDQKVATLEKQLEDLRSDYRKLEERLEKLEN
jgi:aminopeptidase N